MNVRSMTGFGRARAPLSSRWTAELSARSVNHRFLDLTFRLRDAEAELEPALREAFSRQLSRGKVDVSLRLLRTEAAPPEVAVDEGLLGALLTRLEELSRRYPVRGELSAARDLLAVPHLVSVETAAEGFSPDEVAALEELAGRVASALVAMREQEGRRIGAELLERAATLESRLAPIAARRDEIVTTLAATLRDRMRALFGEISLDPGRLEQEAALAAERSDVAEEIARLSGHLQQLRELVEEGRGPIGKKLDFLSQEILREINTLGSKARDRGLTREVLDMKAETEKIREQVQNVE